MAPVRYLIVGTGATGLSCARFLSQQGAAFDFYDTRRREQIDSQALSAFAPAQVFAQTPPDLANYQVVLLSPGVSIEHPLIRQAQALGIAIWGDVELFARHVTQPVIAITGSNGKSTVTSLVGHVLKMAGVKAAVGGNLGRPALDLLDEDAAVYVLEISSFQMESVSSLAPLSACVLNVSPDHLDRHGSMARYAQLKLNLLKQAAHVIYNRQDPWVMGEGQQAAFGTNPPRTEQEYGVIETSQGLWLSRGETQLMPVDEIGVQGAHNWANVLAAWALMAPLGLPDAEIRRAVQTFESLPHRCELVAEVEGVLWIDDSKATNIGAMHTAVAGLGEAGKRILLLAGGQGKGQDFAPARAVIERYCQAVWVFGEAAPDLMRAWQGACPVFEVADMPSALALAKASAQAGSVVLLSPACASFDQFSGYAHRGEVFKAWVKAEVCRA